MRWGWVSGGLDAQLIRTVYLYPRESKCWPSLAAKLHDTLWAKGGCYTPEVHVGKHGFQRDLVGMDVGEKSDHFVEWVGLFIPGTRS